MDILYTGVSLDAQRIYWKNWKHRTLIYIFCLWPIFETPISRNEWSPAKKCARSLYSTDAFLWVLEQLVFWCGCQSLEWRNWKMRNAWPEIPYKWASKWAKKMLKWLGGRWEVARNDDCEWQIHVFYIVLLFSGETNLQTLADYEGEAVKGAITSRIFRSFNFGASIYLEPGLKSSKPKSFIEEGPCGVLLTEVCCATTWVRILLDASANLMKSHSPPPKSMSEVNVNNVLLNNHNLHGHFENIFYKKALNLQCFHHFLSMFASTKKLRSLSTRAKI